MRTGRLYGAECSHAPTGCGPRCAFAGSGRRARRRQTARERGFAGPAQAAILFIGLVVGTVTSAVAAWSGDLRGMIVFPLAVVLTLAVRWWCMR